MSRFCYKFDLPITVPDLARLKFDFIIEILNFPDTKIDLIVTWPPIVPTMGVNIRLVTALAPSAELKLRVGIAVPLTLI